LFAVHSIALRMSRVEVRAATAESCRREARGRVRVGLQTICGTWAAAIASPALN